MRRTHVVALLALALVLGLLGAGCLNGEETTATAETVVGTLPTAAPAEELPAMKLEGDAAAGKEVFASAACGGCHTLAAAGATATVGPNLDEAKPDKALVVERVTLGKSPMPAFGGEGGQLTDQQIADVAAFVTESTGG